MRIVYDDTMQNEAVLAVREVINYLAKGDNVNAILRDEYRLPRAQRGLLKERLACALDHRGMTIGNDVHHAHGIGNNCRYPVYYHPENDNEIQHCAYLHINIDPYGEAFVYVTDYDDKRVGRAYALSRHGVRLV